MDKLIKISPTQIVLPSDSKEVLDFLTFSDRGAQFLLAKHSKNYRWKHNNPESWLAHKENIKAGQKICILFYDEQGRPWTYSGLAQDLQKRFGWELEDQTDSRIEPKLLPWNYKPHEMRYYQKEATEALIWAGHGAIELPTGCHAKGQGILMFDGSIKKVEDIEINDILMGPDSKPRLVKILHRGRQQMAKVIPVKGQPFIVNIDHILSLQRTTTKGEYNKIKKRRKDYKGSHPIVNISVKDYLTKSKTFKHTHKLYKADIDFAFNEQKLLISPYILGIWLGDGSSAQASLTSMDNEIKTEWFNWVSLCGMKISTCQQLNNKAATFHAVLPKDINSNKNYRANKCNNLLDKLNLLNNKHIPFEYKVSTRENRLELLAGLIDTDGYYNGGYFEIVTKSKQLSDDIAFLARSLGFMVTVKYTHKVCQNGNGGFYYRMSILGNINEVPVRLLRKKAKVRQQIKNTLVTGFNIELLSEDDYYGFEVDSDNLYLMDDFTVTHNSGKTLCVLNLLKYYAQKAIIVSPSINVTNQLYDSCVKAFGLKYVGKFTGTKKQHNKLFTVCTVQSLINLKSDSEAYKELSKSKVYIFDESHTCSPEEFQKASLGVCSSIPKRFFVSATQMRTDGSEMVLKGITGPVVYYKSFKQLADEEFLAKPIFKMFHVDKTSTANSDDPKTETRNQLFINPKVIELAAKIAEQCVNSAGKQVLILIEEFKQFDLLKNYLRTAFEFVHGPMPENEKKRIPQEYWKSDTIGAIRRFNEGQTKILIGTSAISTGIDLFPVGCLIYLQGGISEIKVKQSLGRGTRPTKPDFWYIDFCVKGSPTMERHFWQRVEIYKELFNNIEHYGMSGNDQK